MSFAVASYGFPSVLPQVPPHSLCLITKVESSLRSDLAIDVKVHNIAGMLQVVRPLEIKLNTMLIGL